MQEVKMRNKKWESRIAAIVAMIILLFNLSPLIAFGASFSSEKLSHSTIQTNSIVNTTANYSAPQFNAPSMNWNFRE